MSDSDKLVNAKGQPLIQDMKLVVMKFPKNSAIPSPQAVQHLVQVLGPGYVIFITPMDSEILMGELAKKEMISLHHACHAILEVPDIHFTKQELPILLSALKYVCDKTHPGEGSSEVDLLRRIKKLTEQETIHAT